MKKISLFLSSPVSLHILCSVLHITEPLGAVLHQELLDEIFRHRVNMSRPFDLPAKNLLVDPERVVVEEWRVSGQHLVDQDPQRPPVHRPVVTLNMLFGYFPVVYFDASNIHFIRYFYALETSKENH